MSQLHCAVRDVQRVPSDGTPEPGDSLGLRADNGDHVVAISDAVGLEVLGTVDRMEEPGVAQHRALAPCREQPPRAQQVGEERHVRVVLERPEPERAQQFEPRDRDRSKIR